MAIAMRGLRPRQVRARAPNIVVIITPMYLAGWPSLILSD